MDRLSRTSTPSSRQYSSVTGLKRTAGIVSVEGCLISINDFGAREGTPAVKTIDLNDFWLPPTKIYASPTPLGSRDDLVAGVATAVLGLGGRTSSTSKSGVIRVATSVLTLSKFIEYGWLNGLYSWKDWSPAATRRMLKVLGMGGWTVALNLVARTEIFFQHLSDEQLAQFIHPSHAKCGGYSLRESFRDALGTNLRQTELDPVKIMILERLKIRKKDTESHSEVWRARKKLRSHEAGMSAVHLRQNLISINLLAEHGDNPPLEFIPFPETVKMSAQHGRAGRRTENLTPDVVAHLLKDAFWWIEEVSDPILDLCENISLELDARIRANCTVNSKHVFMAISGKAAFKRLESKIGMPIASVGLGWDAGDDDISLKQLIYSLATACFVTIAFLNARRKDEIAHRKIGLHRRALRVVSRDLRLYECEFFVLKSKRAYVPFYIGEITRTAIRVLEKMSDTARALQRILGKSDFIPEDVREDKLFQLPQFSSKSEGYGSQWYMFRTGAQGHANYFMWRALRGNPIHIHPHMFRRAYALIHHYRFEHGTLQQLSQQLVHTHLAMTVGYVRDLGVSNGETPALAYANPDPSVREIQLAAVDEINNEIADVARERVRELVFQVINDGPRASGGFARLIQRFHQRLGKRIEYRLLSNSAQSQMISESLINHGHAFRPMRQANCVASPTRRSRLAKCYSSETGGLSRIHASPSTCTDCPYGHWVEGHHASIEADIVELEAEIATDQVSIKGRARVIELANLRRVLELRRKRLAGTKGH